MTKIYFTIEMCRGDTSDQYFTVDTGGTEITFDEIFFTVKKRYADTKKLIQKKLSDGTIYEDGDKYFFRIEAEDTNNLSFGEYVCDIELDSGEDIIRTFNGRFILDEEATTARDKV